MAEVDKAAPEKAQPQQQQQNADAPDLDEKEPEAPKYTQAEMDRITTKVRRNAARDAELRFRREQGVRQDAPPPDKKEPPKDEVEPKREDFEDYESHQRAIAAFEGRRATREELKKADDAAQQRTVAEKQQQAAQAWKGKIDKAVAKIPDFEDVLEENGEVLNVIHAAPMRAFITESDIGPEIIHHLCTKPEEAKRIAALPRYKQAAEIAKIEDTLVAAAKPKEEQKVGDDEDDDETPEAKEARLRNGDGTFKPKKEPQKKLDEPIEPVSGRPARASAEPLDTDDADTWRRKEVARLAKLRGK